MIPLQLSAVRDDPTTPPLSVLIQGRSGPSSPTSAMRTHALLLSDLFPQWVDPTLQPSAVNPPLLPHIFAFPLQQDVPPLHPLSMCVLLLLIYPYRFKGKLKPLFYLQPCALMFLCFLPCFFGKACLFVSPQRACSSSSAFSLAYSTRCASSSASNEACYSPSSILCIASRDRRTPTSTFSCAHLCSSTLVMVSDVCEDQGYA